MCRPGRTHIHFVSKLNTVVVWQEALGATDSPETTGPGRNPFTGRSCNVSCMSVSGRLVGSCSSGRVHHERSHVHELIAVCSTPSVVCLECLRASEEIKPALNQERTDTCQFHFSRVASTCDSVPLAMPSCGPSLSQDGIRSAISQCGHPDELLFVAGMLSP